jgi:hypothetical protein
MYNTAHEPTEQLIVPKCQRSQTWQKQGLPLLESQWALVLTLRSLLPIEADRADRQAQGTRSCRSITRFSGSPGVAYSLEWRRRHVAIGRGGLVPPQI